MNTARMPEADLYDRYFGDCPREEQAAQFGSEAEVRDYVLHQIGEHYPEDAGWQETITRRLWEYLSGTPRWIPGAV